MIIGTLILIAFLVLVIAAIMYFIAIYNQLVQVKVNIDKSWANIEVLEKQRFDEIPKLVKICEGYMQYERETLEKVIAARTKYLDAGTPAQKAAAGADMSGALKTLFAVAENYPQLKADENFVHLQDRVTALENDLADRREFYNESVAVFNTRIKQVPDMFVANMLGYQPKEMYQVAAEEKKSPEIKFNLPK
ncbi:MAG TPA: LemA family protein [Candidatus Edwardsbacteria bacterium]|nr:LemA family protein [Candidatus Edwardsbacteria bacterium]